MCRGKCWAKSYKESRNNSSLPLPSARWITFRRIINRSRFLPWTMQLASSQNCSRTSADTDADNFLGGLKMEEKNAARDGPYTRGGKLAYLTEKEKELCIAVKDSPGSCPHATSWGNDQRYNCWIYYRQIIQGWFSCPRILRCRWMPPNPPEPIQCSNKNSLIRRSNLFLMDQIILQHSLIQHLPVPYGLQMPHILLQR